MSLKPAAAGALVGAILLTGGVIGWKILEGAGQAAAERPQVVALTESAEARPTYASAQEISEALSKTPVGCTNFATIGRLVNGESEAAECDVDQWKARISMYSSRRAVGDVLDRSAGRDAYGMPVVVVAGENWIVTFPRASDQKKSTSLAEQIAETLNGAVIKMK